MGTLKRMPSLGLQIFPPKEMGLKMERNRRGRNDWEVKSLGFEKNQRLPLMENGDGQQRSYFRVIKDGL